MRAAFVCDEAVEVGVRGGVAVSERISGDR